MAIEIHYWSSGFYLKDLQAQSAFILQNVHNKYSLLRIPVLRGGI